MLAEKIWRQSCLRLRLDDEYEHGLCDKPDANAVWVVKETVIDFDLAVGILSAGLIDNSTPDTWPPSLSENVFPGLSGA